MTSFVSSAHQRAAEDVRSHLVVLRGGAPFLSSADARLLREWLEAGLATTHILGALERAAQARRCKRSRVPLSLRHAKRHLYQGAQRSAPKKTRPSTGHPLAALQDPLAQAAKADPQPALAMQLLTDLLELDASEPDVLLHQALGHCRRFFAQHWSRQSPTEREAALARARQELGDLLRGLSEPQVFAATEEVARDYLRQRYSCLSVAALTTLVYP